MKTCMEDVRRDTMEEMKTYMNEQMLGIVAAMGWALPPEFEANMKASNSTPLPIHDHSSCHSVDPFAELKEPVTCWLVQYAGEVKVVVAKGMVWPWIEGKMVHGTPLTREYASVSIDVIIDPTAPLPVPFSGFLKVGDVEGSFAEWPKSLVLLGDEEPDIMLKKNNKSKEAKESGNKAQPKHGDGILSTGKSNGKRTKSSKQKCTNESGNKKAKHKDDNGSSILCKVKESEKHQKSSKSKKTKSDGNIMGKAQNEDDDDSRPLSTEELRDLGPDCKALEKMLLSLSLQLHNLITITIHASVYNFKKSINMHLSSADIRQMFKYKWLNISILQLWGSFLYRRDTSAKLSDIGYMCPQRLCSYMHTPLEMENYVVEVMKKENKYVMGAFFDEY